MIFKLKALSSAAANQLISQHTCELSPVTSAFVADSELMTKDVPELTVPIVS
jgi:hypothetical protein